MSLAIRLSALALICAAGPASAAWEARRVTPAQLRQAMNDDQAITIVDVRAPAAYAQGHIPGAINVPYADLRTGGRPPATLRKDNPAYLYCT